MNDLNFELRMLLLYIIIIILLLLLSYYPLKMPMFVFVNRQKLQTENPLLEESAR